MFRQLVCSLSVVVEHSSWLQQSTTDHLQSPLPSGPYKRRRITVEVKHAVARAAAEGSVARNATGVMAVVQRLRGYRKRKREGKANSFVYDRVALYWAVVRAMFQQAIRPVFSLTMDATRAGGRDMLYSAVYCQSLGLAAWLPPQARALMHTNTSAAKRRKHPAANRRNQRRKPPQAHVVVHGLTFFSFGTKTPQAPAARRRKPPQAPAAPSRGGRRLAPPGLGSW